MRNKNDRIIFLDYLRILSMLAVVFLHLSAQNWGRTNVNTFEWNVFNVGDSFVRWGVPVFAMISGALFLGKEQTIKKLFKKNVLRIFIILVFWSVLYAV